MCTLISAVVPARTDEAAASTLARQWRHGWSATNNPHVLAQLHPGERYYVLTGGHCSCGTALGSLGSHWQRASKNASDQVPALRRKGWSQAKIARWLKDKQRVTQRRGHAAVQAAGYASTAEEEDYIGFIRALVEDQSAGSVCLLLHEYRGDVADERIELTGRTKVPLTELSASLLRTMAYDHLYEFRRAHSGGSLRSTPSN